MRNPEPIWPERLLPAISLAVLLIAVLCVCAVLRPAGTSRSESKPDVSRLSVQELIGRLQDEASEGIGTESTAWASAFLAVDEEPVFRGGILGSRKPQSSPVMRELVRRGCAALPELLAHLEDARETKLVIAPAFSSMWHSDEYASRFGDPKMRPPGINTGLKKSIGSFRGEKFESSYTIRAGDLCFVAVGQIVNRGLNAVRYQPTACIVINSPVETPALAAAARREWTGLTVEAHRQSLLQDAYCNNHDATASAVVRLLFYYPQTGEPLALQLLNRPLYDANPVQTFIEERLIKTDDPARWKSLLEEFRTTHGQAMTDTIPVWVHHIFREANRSETAEYVQNRERAAYLLARCYPQYHVYEPPFINAATLREQGDLVKSLACCRSRRLDEAVALLLPVAKRFQTTSPYDCRELDELVAACNAHATIKKPRSPHD